MRNYKIFNNQQPTRFVESLPAGNGRMGASFMCAVSEETVYLNEESIWGSKEGGKVNPEMPEKLKQIRDLFLEGKIIEADTLGETILNDCYTRICSYEYAGKLLISLHENDQSRNYSHTLDLVNGIVYTEYDRKGSHYKREAFASYPDDVIAYRITSDKEPLNAYISFERENTIYTKAENFEITNVSETVSGNHKFCTKVRVITDGKATYENESIIVSDTNEIIFLIKIETEFKRGENFEKITFPKLSFDELKERHIKDFSEIIKRADITLPVDECSEKLTIQQRKERMLWNKPKDENMYALAWQFGRYLLVSSSRKGSLPANLQGVWTNAQIAAWSGDYHTNINLQENYWAAECANLSDCHEQLFEYMNKYLLESGRETARVGYGARGCVVHHLSDIYGFTCPADGLHGMWPHGASWLSYHMWEHYLFNKDEDFLKNNAYEFIKQSSLFFLDTMVENNRGYLVFGPSHSPENRYYIEDENGMKHKCTLTMSAAMDIEIISGLLEIYVKASDILGISDDDVEYAKVALTKMPPLVIGKYGQLCDWMEDYEEFEVGHHHVSPAFGLYPGTTINRSTPELLKAIEVMLHRRLTGKNANGEKSNALKAGLSTAWFGCLYARLYKPEDAYGAISNFVKFLTASNLFYNDKCDWWSVFQIDGNLGYVAAVCEMLIQSHEGVISLIPAIPTLWDYGNFRGLKARGGYEVDIEWKDYSVEEIKIKAKFDGECVIELPKTQKKLKFADQNGTVYSAVDNRITVNIKDNIILK